MRTNDLAEILRRPSLRSQLNQIRLWVRQGRTDAWIAHALDISVEQLQTFKRDQGLNEDPGPAPAAPPAEFGSEVDLDDEGPADEELADEVQAEEELADEDPAEEGSPMPTVELYAPESEPEEELEWEAKPEVTEPQPERAPRSRRRGRRGGRRRTTKTTDAYEATFDHGDEGYGLWLDPAVAENDVYSEHWAGHRAVSVSVEPDAITIRRVDVDGKRG